MSRWILLIMAAGTVILFFFVPRLPAPIVEEITPTPSPEKLASPKPKRTNKVSSNNSESSARPKTVPSPQIKATPQRNPFDGTWFGTCAHVGTADNMPITLVISGTKAAVTRTYDSQKYDSGYQEATCDGQTMRWSDTCTWTLTPNADGKTALVTVDFTQLLGPGSHSSATFRKASP